MIVVVCILLSVSIISFITSAVYSYNGISNLKKAEEMLRKLKEQA